jgi:hypothetical protein
VARFAGFAELLEVGDDELRALIDSGGDAPERLWAVWALALRRDQGVVGVARDLSRGDPSPGVRAHMALILVAHGERAAAATLARLDPEPLVRASACRNLARVAGPRDADLHGLLATAMRSDPSSEVRAAVADGLGDDAPEALRAACVDQLHDPDEDVRATAVSALLRQGGDRLALPKPLRDRWAAEPSPRVRGAILRAWLDAEGPAAMLRDAAARPAREVILVIDAIDEARVAIDVELVEPILGRADETLDLRVLALDDDGSVRLPLRWLLELVARDLRSGGFQRAHAAAPSLAGALARASAVDAVDGGLIAEVLVRIEAAIARLAAAADVGADDVVRYLRDDLEADLFDRVDEAYWADAAPAIAGVELLPDLRRLARAPA